MKFKLSHFPYISTLIHSTSTVPQQWIKDIKHVEFNELLASSASALALIFRWKKADKSEFIEDNENFELLIKSLSKDYDMIVCDTMPITYHPDSILISKFTNSILTIKHNLMLTCQMLFQ